jgi:TPR repeat protein
VAGNTELQHLPNHYDSVLLLSEARTSLIARGRKDIAGLVASRTGTNSTLVQNGGCETDPEFWLKKGLDLYESEQYEEIQEVIDCYMRGLQLDSSHAELHWKLGWALHKQDGMFRRIGDCSLSFSEMIRAAELGHIEARFTIGGWYRERKEVPLDYRKATYWLEAAVKQGSENAQGILGQMYYEGQGVERDYVRAFQLLRDAAHVEFFVWEQFLVATMYFQGRGVAQDLDEALKLCRRAIGNSSRSGCGLGGSLRHDLMALESEIKQQLAVSEQQHDR